jgi:hypothetical protein
MIGTRHPRLWALLAAAVLFTAGALVIRSHMSGPSRAPAGEVLKARPSMSSTPPPLHAYLVSEGQEVVKFDQAVPKVVEATQGGPQACVAEGHSLDRAFPPQRMATSIGGIPDEPLKNMVIEENYLARATLTSCLNGDQSLATDVQRLSAAHSSIQQRFKDAGVVEP